MKIKQHLVITNVEDFLRGDYSLCFNLYGSPSIPDGWVYVSEIEIDVDVNMESAVGTAMEDLDRQIDTVKLVVTALECRKRDLLALTHQPTMQG
jgi:hypothetical protein